MFENAATLRETAPVRIAGVNVGEVTAVEPDGNATEVTFTVDDEGLPLHTDATVEIRPRLFLEGNFFLDADPGSPSAPELEDGGTIPVTQTSVAVQLDQVLTTLQKPDRENLSEFLEGFGTGLTHEPTAEEDRTQDPAVQGESAAVRRSTTRSATAATRGGPRRSSTRRCSGSEPHDLSRLIASQRRIFGALLSREEQLKDLITNFNITTGRPGGRVGEPQRHRARARADPRAGRSRAPAPERVAAPAAHLRARARAQHPRAAGNDRRAGTPWLRQTRELLRKPRARRARRRSCARRRRTSRRTTHNSIGLLRQTGLTSLCAVRGAGPDRQRRDRQRRRRVPVQHRPAQLPRVLLHRRAAGRRSAGTSTATAPTSACSRAGAT